MNRSTGRRLKFCAIASLSAVFAAALHPAAGAPALVRDAAEPGTQDPVLTLRPGDGPSPENAAFIGAAPTPTPIPTARIDLALSGVNRINATFTLHRNIDRPFTVFAVLIRPDGTMLNSLSLTPLLKPVAANVPNLHTPFSYLIMDKKITWEDPFGEYEVAVAFFDPALPITGRQDAFLVVSAHYMLE